MCGLAGFLGLKHFGDMEEIAIEMGNRIAHRGPDDYGIWVDREAGIALSHRRLAIVDLTAAGHQPMISASGRFVLVFNGEIYNHQDIRDQLNSQKCAPNWRGHSDTETILAAIEAWGVVATLSACVGMFSIALWDRQTRELLLARDRFGEKPLYYGWQGGVLMFASELKALEVHPAFERKIDRNSIALLLKHNCIPSPYSIWQGINKLLPGSLIRLTAGNSESLPEVYWSLKQASEDSQSLSFQGSEHEALEALEYHLSRAIRGQMLADVPLGALLSGGIDSSMVVAMMQLNSSRPVKTFSIGFHEKEFDESAHARAVAKYLGTHHTELFLSARDVLDMVPRMPLMYDEPFADSSQLPTAMVMSLARQHVTVALSGDGGDEIFGGYNRYMLSPKLWRYIKSIPMPLRRKVGQLLTNVPVEKWDKYIRPISDHINQNRLGDKLHKLGNRLQLVTSIDELHISLLTEWTSGSIPMRNYTVPRTSWTNSELWPNLQDPVARMMCADALSYMPDDILVKVDRAAMAASLETRAPFLDHRLAEFSWSLPSSLRINKGQSKYLLRQLLYKHIPRKLIDRPKMGFGMPLDDWLRGELREWGESLLNPTVLEKDGYFNASEVRKAWDEHQYGNKSYGYRLWSILMFQAWLRERD